MEEVVEKKWVPSESIKPEIWAQLHSPSTPLGSEPVSEMTSVNSQGNAKLRQPSIGSESKSDHKSHILSDSNALGDSHIKKESPTHDSLSPPLVSDEKETNGRPSPSKKRAKAPIQLIENAPRAEKEALASFETLETNWHQYKYLGKSKIQEDAMACECQYEHGDDPNRACGPKSDCINRLTQVECVEGECRCRSYCQNQRFQKRQYAELHIVKTENKGFGLRAARPLKRDDFIYEYVGEVVSEPSFYKRMRDYGDEGIEHFYFMMLQKDEFIDATKKGGIGRFANHSCNPNSYVARWVVDNRLRMGIFAKRDIQLHEEITFNYNVDRYGHEAQKCYCGELNCVGFIGGKTQTDLGGMDDLFIDALGISEEVERLGLKGNRKKKSKKLDEDFTPVLKPMVEDDVPKVVNAIGQTSNKNILMKLITRIKITEDQAVLRQITRLRGLTLMTPTLREYKDDIEVQILILETIQSWPFVNRTKIEDAKIEQLLTELTSADDDRLKDPAQKLLMQWASLERVYRIPKKTKRDEDTFMPVVVFAARDFEEPPAKRQRVDESPPPPDLAKPLGIRGASFTKLQVGKRAPSPPAITQPSKLALSEIIARASEAARQAQAAQEAEAAAAAEEELRQKEERALKKQRAKEKSEKHKRNKEKARSKSHSKSNGNKPKAGTSTQQAVAAESSMKKLEPSSNREKQLHKLVGSVVVGYLTQHRQHFEGDEFKKHAKELTHRIAELEKKGKTYQSGAKLESLSEEKRIKIKAFVKSYVGKTLRKAQSGSQEAIDPRLRGINELLTHEKQGEGDLPSGKGDMMEIVDKNDDDGSLSESSDSDIDMSADSDAEPDVEAMEVDASS